MPSSKLLCRAALRIRHAMQFRSQEVPGAEQPILKSLAERQRAMMRSGQRLRRARAHGLTLIVPQLQQELLTRADDVNYSLGQLRSLLEGSAPPVASAADLHAELKQLQDEFGNLSIAWKDRVVSVTSERIVLEDFDRGPFAIQLHWERLRRHADIHCFDVVPAKPRPAAVNDRVTHPHVKDYQLCAGDAAAPLQRAMEQGRLADAFMLIRSVLSRYNPHSAYARLDEWDGEQCHDCGRSISGDDVTNCESCDERFCTKCMSSCERCWASRCSECIQRCEVCDVLACECCLHSSQSGRLCCQPCLAQCPACNAIVAKDELGKNGEPCPTCRSHPPAPASPVPLPEINPLEEPHAVPEPVSNV